MSWRHERERLALRWRLACELRLHRQLRAAELRAAGAGRWQAWRATHLEAWSRRELAADCVDAWFGAAAGAPRMFEQLRLRGVVPLLLAVASGLLLWHGPEAALVRASVWERLPWPQARHLYLDGLRTPDGSLRGYPNVEPCAAAFRYAGPSGRGAPDAIAVPAIEGTPAFFRALGLRPGPVPSFARQLLRPPQVLMPLPANPDLSVFRLSTFPLAMRVPKAARPAGAQPISEPLGAWLLIDLSYVRWAWMALVALWMALAGADLLRTARERPAPGASRARRLAHALNYWGYAVLTAAMLGLLMATVSGCLVVLWPRLGITGAVATVWANLMAALALVRWCRDDHRLRCRICLRHLRLPRESGRCGGILLSAPAYEYVCVHGHGRLLVPAQPQQPQPIESWSYAGDWWSELCAHERTA